MQRPRSPGPRNVIDDEAHLQFVVGFPCTRFHCDGWLRDGTHGDHRAVVCSVCAHCYYLFVES